MSTRKLRFVIPSVMGVPAGWRPAHSGTASITARSEGSRLIAAEGYVRPSPEVKAPSGHAPGLTGRHAPLHSLDHVDEREEPREPPGPRTYRLGAAGARRPDPAPGTPRIPEGVFV